MAVLRVSPIASVFIKCILFLTSQDGMQVPIPLGHQDSASALQLEVGDWYFAFLVTSLSH